MVKLRNVTRQVHAFNLEHASFVDAPGANGVGKPESLTFLPLETKLLPDEVLLCRDVKLAIEPPRGGRQLLRRVP